jgi:hypothetical protein
VATDLDSRIVRVSIEIAGQLKTFDGLAVVASGTKYANANQNDCEVKITNLARSTRDYLITEASPYNKSGQRKRLIVEAGRTSTGVSTVFVGDITAATVSQPPDVVVTLKAATGDYDKGNVIQRSLPGTCALSQVAKQVAGDLGLSLNFQCADKQIANYSFTGGALRQVDQLGAAGRVNAFVDDGALILKNYGAPLAGSSRVLNLETGMVGIPEFTERGIKVKMLYDNQTKLGSGLEVSSVLNPAANGSYTVYKLGFELASRDTPFYLIAEAQRADGTLPNPQPKKATQ